MIVSMVIDFHADLICPWCHIGLIRLRRALAERPHIKAEIRWNPFELNPHIPPEGMDRHDYLSAKFGSLERGQQIYGAIQHIAENDGIPLALDRIERTPNTRNAHRLVRLAEQHGVMPQVIDALFHAYLLEGRDIGDPHVLLDIGTICGLSATTCQAQLIDDSLSSIATLLPNDVQAVPWLVFNKRLAIAGAQEPKTLLPLIDAANTIDETALAFGQSTSGG